MFLPLSILVALSHQFPITTCMPTPASTDPRLSSGNDCMNPNAQCPGSIEYKQASSTSRWNQEDSSPLSLPEGYGDKIKGIPLGDYADSSDAISNAISNDENNSPKLKRTLGLITGLLGNLEGKLGALPHDSGHHDHDGSRAKRTLGLITGLLGTLEGKLGALPHNGGDGGHSGHHDSNGSKAKRAIGQESSVKTRRTLGLISGLVNTLLGLTIYQIPDWSHYII